MNAILAANGRRLAFLVLAGFALVSSGCLVVAAGAGAGAAVASYAYVKGKVCYTFNASLEDSWAASRTALTELGLPLLGEERESTTSGFLKSQTSDGTAIRIYLEVEPSPFPTEGPHTRACVRVGTFGDYPISDRILNQLSAHLVPVGVNGQALPPAPPPAGPAASPAWTPAAQPQTTSPPPLLPPEPSKKK